MSIPTVLNKTFGSGVDTYGIMTTITVKVVFEPPNPSFFDPVHFDEENPGADNNNHISFEEFFISKGIHIAYDLLEFIYRASFWYENESANKNDESLRTFINTVIRDKNLDNFEIWIEPSALNAIFFEFRNIPKEIKSGVAYVANIPFSERSYENYKIYHDKMTRSFFHFSLTRSYFENDLYWLDYYPGQTEFQVQGKYIAMYIDSIKF